MTGNKRPGLVLQGRDLRLLSELGVMRIVDREMAKAVAGFKSTRRANARLLQLTRTGFLKRFFVGSIAHGRKAVYTLSPKGTTLVSAKLGGINRPAGRLVVGDTFVEHQCAINQVYLALRYFQTPTQIPVGRWLTFQERISDTIKIAPDGYFEAGTVGSIRTSFLEVDLGTEALQIWQQKAAYYLQLALSGDFPKIFGQSQFRVLVVANSERRLMNIRSVVAKSTDKIFWFTTLETIQRDGIWSPIWLRPKGDQRVPIA